MVAAFDVGAPGYRPERFFLTPPRLIDVEDGLSNTLLLVEQAGKPMWFWLNVPDFPQASEPTNGAWLACELHYLVDWPPVNVINISGIFSYHPGLAHVSLCDGSVTTLSDQVNPRVILALISRSNGEVIRDQDLR